MVVVDDGSGLASAVVEQFAAHHITAVVGLPEPDAWGVLLLGGLADDAFRIARTVARRMTDRGGVFVTVQDTGGCFGLVDPRSERALLGGLAALARTAALEWPLAAVKAIDCQRGDRDEDAVAAAIVAELLTGGSTLDVGLRADGTRWTVGHEEVPATPGVSPITADSVLVATGGARGITAAALLALASAHCPRMLLIGRTSLTDDHTARGVVAAREIRANLDAFERAGATVRYAAVDVTDEAALKRELDQARLEWGPITGLVHGAGVLADKLIADKTDEQFDRVYATKVAGWQALLAATESDPLRLLCVFSSVAARFGNPGQSDYAMANETLNQLACAEAARRPDCRVRSIGWGPWQGGMVNPSLAAHFIQRGVPLIPLAAGARAFVAEVESADDAVEILVGAGQIATHPRTAAEITVNSRTHDYLADHAPAGTPVLPLAMALEWFTAASGGTHLCDVRVLSRIDLPDLAAGHRFTIEGQL
ncbi:MAG TPA: SDR family NAD(P)-dependent oxidoreductase, partial [Pseudonocardiaceae bacterium]|nr:SDR family NAD(P)-dependent oxidoreductase [Pseudonocardiaceae bacterium]